MNVADKVAEWLIEKGATHAFGIIGAGNIGIFDAIARAGKTEIICTHHEQAAAQAAAYYWRVCGRIAPVICTTGAGSANAITGVLAAWMDSVPLMVLSGNEPMHFITKAGPRVIGVQGYDSVEVAKHFTKFAWRPQPHNTSGPMITDLLDTALEKATTPRYGPVWLDFPRDLQTRQL